MCISATRLGEQHEVVGRTRDDLDRLTRLLASIPEPTATADHRPDAPSAEDLLQEGPAK